MKVATTVFVGNISDKATDTLVRQILLVSSFANFDTRICVLTGSSVGTPFNCTMLSQLLTFDLCTLTFSLFESVVYVLC